MKAAPNVGVRDLCAGKVAAGEREAFFDLDRQCVLEAVRKTCSSATLASLEEVWEMIEIQSLYPQRPRFVWMLICLASILLSPEPSELWTADSSLR